MSSPSSLSSISTDSPQPSTIMPVKRSAPDSDHDHDHEMHSPAADDSDYVSSDTSGSVPASPGGADEHDRDEHEQVTVCRWDGCDKDLYDMDSLVAHIHDVHVGTRKATYSCQWDDCGRKGLAHASGYALRAHMRSHTKEKPFYCSLPECDRSFTRSDALAKHMRTVHETEALRPSDPVPKSHPTHPQNRNLPHPIHPHIFSDVSDHSVPGSPHGENGISKNNWYEPEDGLDEDEMEYEPPRLLRLLKEKEKVAREENEELKATLADLERRRKEAWVKKEMLLERVIIRELGEEEARGISLDTNV